MEMEIHRRCNFFFFWEMVVLDIVYMVNVLHKICLPNGVAYLKNTDLVFHYSEWNSVYLYVSLM